MSDDDGSPFLTKTEAEKLISERVKTELERHARRLIKIIGIPNSVALVTFAFAIAGMWFTIQAAATSAAENKAALSAETAVNHVVPVINAEFTEMMHNINQTEQKRVEFQNSIASFQTNLEALSKAVHDTENRAHDTSANAEGVQKLIAADQSRERDLTKKLNELEGGKAAQMGTVLQNLPPEAVKLIANLNDLFTRLLPIGTILLWQTDSNSTLPSAYKICDGSTIHDPESLLDGKTLPDLRGEFLRGADDMGTGSRNVDNGRKAGTFETDSLRRHQHTVANLYPFTGNLGPIASPVGNALVTGYPYQQAPEMETKPFGGDETRPRNYAVVFVMRGKVRVENFMPSAHPEPT